MAFLKNDSMKFIHVSFLFVTNHKSREVIEVKIGVKIWYKIEIELPQFYAIWAQFFRGIIKP